MKFPFAIGLSLVIGVVLNADQSAVQASHNQYVLRNWRVEGAGNLYLWSIEESSSKYSPGLLYRSLSSPGLQAEIGKMKPGAHLSFKFSGGGDVVTVNAVMGKDFEDFTAICKQKKIRFDFSITTN